MITTELRDFVLSEVKRIWDVTLDVRHMNVVTDMFTINQLIMYGFPSFIDELDIGAYVMTFIINDDEHCVWYMMKSDEAGDALLTLTEMRGKIQTHIYNQY